MVEYSSSRITLTGQNRTDLLDLPLDDGVLLRQDLEKEDAEEQVVAVEEEIADCGSDTAVLIFLGFLGLVAVLLKSELRKVASLPPGEMGCFTFFKSV